MKGLDTVESLSAEASDNLSTNSFCMMKTIFTALGFTKTRALVLICTNLGKIFLVLKDLPKLGLLHTNLGKRFLVL